MDKELTPQERIDLIVKTTAEFVKQQEAGIRTIQKQGTLEHGYKPRGSRELSSQAKGQVKKLQANIEQRKTKDLEQIEKIVSELPPEQQALAWKQAVEGISPKQQEVKGREAFQAKHQRKDELQQDVTEPENQPAREIKSAFNSKFIRADERQVKTTEEPLRSKFMERDKEDKDK